MITFSAAHLNSMAMDQFWRLLQSNQRARAAERSFGRAGGGPRARRPPEAIRVGGRAGRGRARGPAACRLSGSSSSAARRLAGSAHSLIVQARRWPAAGIICVKSELVVDRARRPAQSSRAGRRLITVLGQRAHNGRPARQRREPFVSAFSHTHGPLATQTMRPSAWRRPPAPGLIISSV